MQYDVTRMQKDGRVLPPRLRTVSRTRGAVSITQENDPARHRVILVARLDPLTGRLPILPLYDVTLISCTGSIWTVTGFERVIGGVYVEDQSVSQTWLIEPAVNQDVIDLEANWGRAAREAVELREQLEALRGAASASS